MRRQTSTANQSQRFGTCFACTSLAVLLALVMIAGCSPEPSSTPADAGLGEKTVAPDEGDEAAGTTPSPGQAVEPKAASKEVAETTKSDLPRLLDLGAGKCIPCKMMAPILDELKEKYEGTLEVEFIDVWKNPDEAEKYGIDTIPTQIFFDASGKERFRHVGFFAKEEILAKWKELGVELEE